MKKMIFLVCTTFVILGITSCTKDNSTTDSTLFTEQSTVDFQTAIIGSWQFVEKGVEIVLHDGHVCTAPETMAQNKVTYAIQWKTVADDEKRDFKPNGVYSRYVKATLACQGSYNIANSGILEVTTNCQNSVEKIEGLTTTFLTLKQGDNYFKYGKVKN